MRLQEEFETRVGDRLQTWMFEAEVGEAVRYALDMDGYSKPLTFVEDVLPSGAVELRSASRRTFYRSDSEHSEDDDANPAEFADSMKRSVSVGRSKTPKSTDEPPSKDAAPAPKGAGSEKTLSSSSRSVTGSSAAASAAPAKPKAERGRSYVFL